METTEIFRAQTDGFARRLEECCQLLCPRADAASLAELQQMADAFPRRAGALLEAQQPFTLAVLGQVKAGKSSFLNALFFDGESVLPQAAAPKTAVLTRLEYSQSGQLTTEFYTPEDWAAMQKLAGGPLGETESGLAARQMLADAAACGADFAAARGDETLFFNGTKALREALSQRVCAGGALTPLVRAVHIGLPLPALRGIAVVDTPGLNDPVLSRSQVTRQQIERCDAAFLLSRSSHFLDAADLELLCARLPQKGIVRLFVIGSQFDSAVTDLQRQPQPTAQAIAQARQALTRRAVLCVREMTEKLRRSGRPQALLELLAPCSQPLFCSALAQRMAQQVPSRYSAQERAVAALLFPGEKADRALLLQIGNFAAIRALLQTLQEEKEAARRRRQSDFLLLARADLQGVLERIGDGARARQRQLEAERAALQRQSAALGEQITRIRREAAPLFADYGAEIAAAFARAAAALQQSAGAPTAPAERTALSLHQQAKTVSDTVLYKPWTWGRNHREYTVQESALRYQDPREGLEDLRQLTAAAAQLYGGICARIAERAPLRNRLIAYAAGWAQSAGEELSGEALEHLLALVLGCLTAPVFAPDCAQACRALERQFPDRVFEPTAQAALRGACAQALRRQGDELARGLTDCGAQFAARLDLAETEFARLLGAPAAAQRAAAADRLAQLENEIGRQRELLDLLATL